MQGQEHRQGERQGYRGGLWIFAIQWLTIGIISAIDCYWSIRLQDSLYENEENPIGRYLIELDDGGIALFMMLKIIGTITALGILALLLKFKPKMAHISCFCICILQIALLLYLVTG